MHQLLTVLLFPCQIAPSTTSWCHRQTVHCEFYSVLSNLDMSSTIFGPFWCQPHDTSSHRKGLCGCVWRPCQRAQHLNLLWISQWVLWRNIRSTSTPHFRLTTIHKCWACSLRRSLLNTCAEISSVRVLRVVKVGHKFFCDNMKLSQSSASWRPGNMTLTVSRSPRAPCQAAEHFCENTSQRMPSCNTP